MKPVIRALLACLPAVVAWGDEVPAASSGEGKAPQESAAAACAAGPRGGRAMFGVLPAREGAEGRENEGDRENGGSVEDEKAGGGVLVEMVAPGSPAGLAGIQPGDCILRMGEVSVKNARQMREILEMFAPGDKVPVELRRGGERRILHVKLVRRPGEGSLPSPDPGYTDRGDRMVHTVSVSPAIRERMREIKRDIRHSLRSLPDGLDAREVIRDLQELRDLARDANPSRQGWMIGRAGEALLQFHDESGTLVLHGVNNLLTLEVYDDVGKLLLTVPLNTREECRALPEELLERLHQLH